MFKYPVRFPIVMIVMLLAGGEFSWGQEKAVDPEMGVVQNAVSQHFARVRSAHGQ